jgi:hypothetical protein
VLHDIIIEVAFRVVNPTHGRLACGSLCVLRPCARTPSMTMRCSPAGSDPSLPALRLSVKLYSSKKENLRWRARVGSGEPTCLEYTDWLCGRVERVVACVFVRRRWPHALKGCPHALKIWLTGCPTCRASKGRRQLPCCLSRISSSVPCIPQVSRISSSVRFAKCPPPTRLQREVASTDSWVSRRVSIANTPTAAAHPITTIARHNSSPSIRTPTPDRHPRSTPSRAWALA